LCALAINEDGADKMSSAPPPFQTFWIRVRAAYYKCANWSKRIDLTRQIGHRCADVSKGRNKCVFQSLLILVYPETWFLWQNISVSETSPVYDNVQRWGGTKKTMMIAAWNQTALRMVASGDLEKHACRHALDIRLALSDMTFTRKLHKLSSLIRHWPKLLLLANKKGLCCTSVCSNRFLNH